MHYGFCCIRSTVRVPPAIEAGQADHVWLLGELAGLAAPRAVATVAVWKLKIATTPSLIFVVGYIAVC